MSGPGDRAAEERGSWVRSTFPALPPAAEAAVRLGALDGVRCRRGTFVCPACSGTGAGDQKTGRVTSTGSIQCGTCFGHGTLFSRGRVLFAWGP